MHRLFATVSKPRRSVVLTASVEKWCSGIGVFKTCPKSGPCVVGRMPPRPSSTDSKDKHLTTGLACIRTVSSSSLGLWVCWCIRTLPAQCQHFSHMFTLRPSCVPCRIGPCLEGLHRERQTYKRQESQQSLKHCRVIVCSLPYHFASVIAARLLCSSPVPFNSEVLSAPVSGLATIARLH